MGELKLNGKSDQLREILAGISKALESESGEFLLEVTLSRVDSSHK